MESTRCEITAAATLFTETPEVVLEDLRAVSMTRPCGRTSLVSAAVASRDDQDTPKSPSCHDDFQLVKVKIWANGEEKEPWVDRLHVLELCCHLIWKRLSSFLLFLQIQKIAAPILPQRVSKSAGSTLKSVLPAGQGEFYIFLRNWPTLAFLHAVEVLLYSPKRPVVDGSVVFLWMMAVGTIICACTASDQSDERYNELTPKESATAALAKEEDDERNHGH
ncbi:hypothetical protein MLD38_023878 [Melastoma candidum]|uniref:Uncharacterized protein n=1 Tax=Melastoma candidum TaxID=119954 RepID=A0ACB9NS51_9MYRT|nr:hypothetical protein MLD38_023878 [Melastoma candidum]